MNKQEYNKQYYQKNKHRWKGYTGLGSGSKVGFGKDNPNYKNGIILFKRLAKERKESLGHCETCGKNLKDATRYEWVGHHIDHDRTNNVEDNLQILCKRCHQIHHECWKALPNDNQCRF